MKQLNVFALNAKDVKDHLPMNPEEEAHALADYATAGIRLHAVGALYFAKGEDADVRAKFEYSKRAGIPVIVAGDHPLGANVKDNCCTKSHEPLPAEGSKVLESWLQSV